MSLGLEFANKFSGRICRKKKYRAALENKYLLCEEIKSFFYAKPGMKLNPPVMNTIPPKIRIFLIQIWRIFENTKSGLEPKICTRNHNMFMISQAVHNFLFSHYSETVFRLHLEVMEFLWRFPNFDDCITNRQRVIFSWVKKTHTSSRNV